MANILGVGIATLDIINTVDGYPAEDSEIRALAQTLRRGGNATNTLVVLSQLDHHCHWAGTLADDANSELIRSELETYGVDLRPVRLVHGGRAPTSCITLNQCNGSRTIVHYRDLPEYGFTDFQPLDLSGLDWLHFEGRNVEQTAAMLAHARSLHPALPLSVEIEKHRHGIAQLIGLADLLFYSRHYAQHSGFHTPEPFLRAMQRQAPAVQHVCGWGEEGAYALEADGALLYSPAFVPARVIDTIGAGDTFNAGFIHARLAGHDPATCLRIACRLAGQKCGQQGFQDLGDSPQP